MCYTFSAVTGSLELQAKPPRPGPRSQALLPPPPTSSLYSSCPLSAAQVCDSLWHLDVLGREIFAELWIFY